MNKWIAMAATSIGFFCSTQKADAQTVRLGPTLAHPQKGVTVSVRANIRSNVFNIEYSKDNPDKSLTYVVLKNVTDQDHNGFIDYGEAMQEYMYEDSDARIEVDSRDITTTTKKDKKLGPKTTYNLSDAKGIVAKDEAEIKIMETMFKENLSPAEARDIKSFPVKKKL